MPRGSSETRVTDATPKRTPLHQIHVTLGAKLVPYGGYEMPVSYPAGIAAEHRAVREAVGVFDVSHMGEFEVTGPDRNAFVQHVTSNDVGALGPGQAQYSAILTTQGTFVDDCVVYRFEDRLMLVVNAANVAKDWDHIVAQKRGANVRLRNISDETALLAVQGPKAESLLAPLTPLGVAMIPYYHFVEGKVAGVQCFISRTGYTGEDGFELYCRAADVETLWHALVGAGRAEPCGLAARDTRRLVGFRVAEPRTVARHGDEVYLDGTRIDIVRSGTVTPTVNGSIGTTYLPATHAAPGTAFQIDVRGKRAPAAVVRLPFVPHRTRRIGG